MKPLCNLFEDIINPENLFRAADATLAHGRRFRGEGARFKLQMECEIFGLHRDLTSGKYRHGPYRLFTVFDPKVRIIAAASVRDRVLHHAVHDVIEPRLDPMFIYDSYACRSGKGTHRALDRAHGFLRANRYGLHLDVKSYFSSIDHEILKGLLRRYVADDSTLALLEQIVDSTDYLARKGGMGSSVSSVTGAIVSQMGFDFADLTAGEDELNKKRLRGDCGIAGTEEATAETACPQCLRTSVVGGSCPVEPAVSAGTRMRTAGPAVSSGVPTLREVGSLRRNPDLENPTLREVGSRGDDRSPPEQAHGVRGIPLGNLTSQFFANLYLNELDQYVKHKLKVRYYVRYMDDMLLFADEKTPVVEWEAAIGDFARDRLRLELHPSGGQRPVGRGVGFLGFRLFPGHRKLKKTSVTRFIRRMNSYTRDYHSLRSDRARQAALLRQIERSVQSFHAHALNGDTYRMRKCLYDRFHLINQYRLAGMRGRFSYGHAAYRGKNLRREQMAAAAGG